jgi:putative flippase GtrA
MIVLPSFYRFCITGVLNTVVHYLTASALFAFGDVSPAIANGGALIVATCFSFVANTLWSFSCRLNARIFARFLIISALACGLAMSVATLLSGWGVPNQLGILGVILVVTPITYLLHRFWTYRQRKE